MALPPITLRLPNSGSISFTDIFDIMEFVFIDSVPSILSPSEIEGFGFYNGILSDYTGLGSGMSLGLVGGFPLVTTGTLERVDFTTGADKLRFVDLDIDQASFATLLRFDKDGTTLFGLEDYLMDRDWNLKLSLGDDLILDGALVGDGAALNLRGDDVINARNGDDTIFSGDGADTVFGGAGEDIIDGGNGADNLRGGSSADTIYGRAGQDRLLGGGGQDSLFGGGSRDVLDGGTGRDSLNGGGGSDRFIFRDGYGSSNTITDFDAFDNAEDIDLRAVTAITDYTDLVTNHMVQSGNDVIINDGAGTRIFVLNVMLGDLDAKDFIF